VELTAPKRVLYIDGEMPLAEIQRRFRSICEQTGAWPPKEGLAFITSDSHPHGLPDLSTDEGQQAFEPYLDGFDLIIVDNVSTLCRSGVENEAESWLSMQTWLIHQRNLGRSILLIHHAGKTGVQRGTSRREDVLDTVIHLKRPAGYDPSDGARFEVNFTKSRYFFGSDAEPIEVQLMPNGNWKCSPVNQAMAEQAIQMAREGSGIRKIATELSVSPSAVSSWVKSAGIKPKRGRPPKDKSTD
jgi:putative DNA primase/helicase